MATKELNASNPGSESLKKIDEHISSLSSKIVKARESGNEAEVKNLVGEGKRYLKEHYKADYQGEFLVKQKELIKKEKEDYKEKKAKILALKQTNEYLNKISTEKENLVKENERYREELNNFISKIDHDKIAKAKEKGLAEISKLKEKYKADLLVLKKERSNDEVLKAREEGRNKSIEARNRFKENLLKVKEEYASSLLDFKSNNADANLEETKEKLKALKTDYVNKKNRLIITLNAELKEIKAGQNEPLNKINSRINDLKIDHQLEVGKVKEEKNAPLNEVKKEKRKIDLLHKKVANSIKDEIAKPKREVRKQLDEAYDHHEKRLTELRKGAYDSYVCKDELTKKLTNDKLNVFEKTQTWCRKVVSNTPGFFERFGHKTVVNTVDLPKNSKNLFFSLPNKKGFNSIVSSLVSIFIGILIGFIFMIVSIVFNSSANPFQGIGYVFAGPFGGSNVAYELGNMLFYAVPLIFTGLSVGIAYKTGLFNIGAPGQFLMGTMGALLVALNINTTGNRFAGVMVWILALIVAIVFALIWAFIPGFLKAQFGINEVIICIMTNWIAANLFSWVFGSLESLHNSEVGKGGFLIKTGETGNFTPSWGLGSLFGSGSYSSYLDISIFFAIIIAILLWVFMNKTTLGYSLKACGYNRNAAKYAGINEKLNILIAMGIAGALAGLGGAFYYLNPGIEMKYNTSSSLPNYGFNGIPAALLANSNPVGIIFTALFIRYIDAGSLNLNNAGYNQNIGSIIIAIIIYLAGFSRFFNEKITLIKKKVTVRKENTKLEMEALSLPSTSKGGK